MSISLPWKPSTNSPRSFFLVFEEIRDREREKTTTLTDQNVPERRVLVNSSELFRSRYKPSITSEGEAALPVMMAPPWPKLAFTVTLLRPAARLFGLPLFNDLEQRQHIQTWTTKRCEPHADNKLYRASADTARLLARRIGALASRMVWILVTLPIGLLASSQYSESPAPGAAVEPTSFREYSTRSSHTRSHLDSKTKNCHQIQEQ